LSAGRKESARIFFTPGMASSDLKLRMEKPCTISASNLNRIFLMVLYMAAKIN
jgi:hypothetical protein